MRRARSHALTSKPVLYVANVDEGDDEVPRAVAAHAAAAGAGAVAVSARIECGARRARRRRGGGDAEPSSASASPGCARLVHAAYELLDLITFFTADQDKEAMARSLRRGGSA